MKVAGTAYGLVISGLSASRLCGLSDDHLLRRLTIETARVERVTTDSWLDDDEVALPVRDWQLRLDRRGRRAVVAAAKPIDAERLIHPVLGIIGAVFARWDGRNAFHAGAASWGSGAWLLLGDRRAGKSTTLARFAQRGFDVLADDVVVTASRGVFCGPRCLDLRAGVAETLRLQDRVVPVRDGEVQRLGLGGVSTHTPIAGWLHLRWGTHMRLRELTARERLEILHEHLTVALKPASDADLLDLAALPALAVERPASDVRGVDRLIDEVLRVAAGSVG